MYFFVSIIVPTYNRRDSLRKTIESLFNQNYPKNKYEILICDDGSSDGTEAFINELSEITPCKLKYLKQDNKGPAAARNLGIRNAEGEIIFFTDDDAVADENWIRAHTNIHGLKEILINGALIPKDTIAGVGGRIKIGNPESLVALYSEYGRYKMFDRETGDELSLGPRHGHPTCNISFKKEVFEKVGLFNEKFKRAVGEDTDFGLKVTDYGYCFIYNPDAIVYHKHPEKIMNLVSKWYNINKCEAMLHIKDPNNKINSPFKLPSKKFLIKYWYLIPIDFFIRISILFGLMHGYLRFGFIKLKQLTSIGN